jgi:oligoendopeptidase F
MQLKQSRFDEISGAQSITYKGNELSLQQAGTYLKSTNRSEREEVYRLMSLRRLQDASALDNLLTELIQLRHKIALNAGYKNYIDFRFAELGRFDYTPEDCLQFHASIQKVLKPLQGRLLEERRTELNLPVLKPWDMEVDTSGKPPLVPTTSTAELITKTITCFSRIDPYFADCLRTMNGLKLLDLDARLNKGIGGYNISMPESGVPFIFMNSTNSEEDIKTMVHESGHAFHSFLSHLLELSFFKETPSEISEVASMSMELITMDNWDVFYTNPDHLRRAKTNFLHHTLRLLPLVCIGDSFQFWMYANPNHSLKERRAKWLELSECFVPGVVDWTGYEETHETSYQRILHFYIVPFYYIEYAFAQLGAMAIWKNFKQNPHKAIEDYKKALSLGYTKTIPQFYTTAGARFDFSENYIARLIDFTVNELEKV